MEKKINKNCGSNYFEENIKNKIFLKNMIFQLLMMVMQIDF